MMDEKPLRVAGKHARHTMAGKQKSRKIKAGQAKRQTNMPAFKQAKKKAENFRYACRCETIHTYKTRPRPQQGTTMCSMLQTNSMSMQQRSITFQAKAFPGLSCIKQRLLAIVALLRILRHMVEQLQNAALGR